MYEEFIGITQRVSRLIESHRTQDTESKSEILERLLEQNLSKSRKLLDIGQGAKLYIGEKIYLYLKSLKKSRNPDAIAEVKEDGIYLNGKILPRSKGSQLTPGMRMVQEQKGHYNDKGEIISLNSWRQWHVNRGNKLIPLLQLKDPEKSHVRGKKLTEEEVSKLTLEDLGL